ncbi:GNAT family N-acetyltransferase [Leuconostoc citreum]|uniref:GNAT family N-acetyltransferase n=1 Tax=Leuconostoc citreum TaxID=33964 RepID=UPI000EC1026C|nr:GNAT family N-acetyltransferase [Leuconostoc citreum]MCT3054707.1 GNAT family N-acetyltransferase [Leuconostoc citreum]MCT3062913.1 GNAT family N-acetyltransferase [Leuconostoc citreum]MCT3074017.1 GNAT family N-acetyltransferase [Leuconostoc citreum]HCN55815.1 N-acetyltransferase [Leuconostoc citreum]
MGHRIIKLEEKNIDEVVSLYIDVFSREPWNEKNESNEIRLYVERMLNLNSEQSFLYTENKHLIGVAIGFVKPWYKGEEYILDTFLIHPNHQKKGLGQLFLTELKKTLNNQGVENIALDTDKHTPAERFYLKNGFKENQESIFLFSSTDIE